jgi:outer membrane protein assembly factor BamB
MRFPGVVLAVGVLLVSAAGGCSGNGSGKAVSPPSAGSAPTVSAPAPRAFDPPTRFDQALVFKLPDGVTRETVALHGSTVYAGRPGALDAVDVTTGTVAATATPKNQPRGTVGSRPFVAEVARTTVVFAVFSVTAKGSGTTRDRHLIEVHALEAATLRPLWTAEIEIADAWPSQPRSDAGIMGLSGSTLVVQNGGINRNAHGHVYALDIDTRTVRWNRDHLLVGHVGDGTLVGDSGGTEHAITALSLADGTERWGLPRYVTNGTDIPTVLGGGTDWALISGYNDRRKTTDLAAVDLATGAERRQLSSGKAFSQCRHDRAAVLVCTRAIQDVIVGVDVRSGASLWQLEMSASRIVPKITAVWHGAVYATTTNGPVVLDANTGKDRQAAPGAEVYVVNQYGGVTGGADRKPLTFIQAAG